MAFWGSLLQWQSYNKIISLPSGEGGEKGVVGTFTELFTTLSRSSGVNSSLSTMLMHLFGTESCREASKETQ